MVIFLCLIIFCPFFLGLFAAGLDSLLLVCGSSSVDGSDVDSRAESPSVAIDGAIDPLLDGDGSAKQPRRPVTPPSSTVEHPENDAEPATVKSVNSEGVAAGGPTVSAVALPTTGNGKRTDRAAEILKTNENQPQQKQQPASFSSSSVLPNPLETITLPSQSSTVSTSLATTSADHIHLEMTSTTTTMTPISTSIETNRPLFATSAAPPEETLQPDDLANVTTSTTTPSGHQISVGNEEYVADDGGFPSPTTDATTDDEETTAITADKSTPALVGDPESDDGHRQNVSSSLADPITTTETLAASQQFSGSPPVVVAVGRALSQEESVPWPEAKSTKVIGTIIEDLHGPFSDGVSSVSTTSPDVLTGSGIAAIVMCTFLVFLTTAGKNTI